MMKKTLLILFILLGFCQLVKAQNFPYGAITQEEMDLKKYAKDTAAHAVVLREYGTSRIITTYDDDLRLLFEYHVKVKIFDSKGFDEATVAIKLRNDEGNNSADKLYEVKGITYYKDEDGLIRQAALDQAKVYNTRDYKYQSTSKFTMPGLRSGCVIEYTYKIEIPGFLNHFRPWEFQGDIPKMYSEYEVHIPGHFNYNVALKGSLKLTQNKAEIEKECFTVRSAKSDCSDIHYGISDIPAFVEEDYMTSPDNFKSAIVFELVDYHDPYRGGVVKVSKEWRDIDYQLRNEQFFGGQIKKKDLFKERVAPVIAGKTTELEKAQAIYAYLQKWFKWNEYIGIYSENGIKKALEARTGSIADINFSLVAALNSAGINTETVLLSTREHGLVNDLFPATNDFNYVVAKANIDGKSYLLDATDPLMPFGMLPLRCLNDKGRVYNPDKPSYWIDLNLPQKESTTYTFDFTLMDDGKLVGTMINYSSGYKAYERRQAIKKFNSVDEYVEDLGGKLPRLKILKSEITYLDSLDHPLSEKYEVELNLYDKLNTNNNLTFNPYILDRMTKNPFKLTERSYPVDWGMPSEERFILIMHLPAQYTIETPPKAATTGLPNNGGKFLTTYEANDNSFTFSHVIQFNKSIYSSAEYPYLKELYNKIIQSEKEEMVFKKK